MNPVAWRPWVSLGTAAGAALAVGGGLFAMTRHNRDVDRLNESGCFEAMGKVGYSQEATTAVPPSGSAHLT